MDTNNPTALRTHPFPLFPADKMPYAELSYHIEILNHTHAILGFITDIQVAQCLTGEAVTCEAVLEIASRSLCTFLDPAIDARFWLGTIRTSASRARVFISHVRPAKATVHSARSD